MLLPRYGVEMSLRVLRDLTTFSNSFLRSRLRTPTGARPSSSCSSLSSGRPSAPGRAPRAPTAPATAPPTAGGLWYDCHVRYLEPKPQYTSGPTAARRPLRRWGRQRRRRTRRSSARDLSSSKCRTSLSGKNNNSILSQNCDRFEFTTNNFFYIGIESFKK